MYIVSFTSFLILLAFSFETYSLRNCLKYKFFFAYDTAMSNLSSKIKTTTATTNQNFENSSEEKNVSIRRTRKSKFKSLLIDKDFEPENPKQLEELDENSCKWPIGHPDESSFYFCGRSSLKDFSYCKLHLLYACQPKGKKDEVTEKNEVPEFIEKKIQTG